MMVRVSAPRRHIVFDVNVLIAAVDPFDHRHDSAVTALSIESDFEVHMSKAQLETTALVLLEKGADPQAVEECIQFLLDPDQLGCQVRLHERVPTRDYGITDRYGRHDYEDNNIAALVDFVEQQTGKPALLLVEDSPMRNWCIERGRAATNLRSFLTHQRAGRDAITADSLDYMAGRAFRNGVQDRSRLSSEARSRFKAQMKDIVRRSVRHSRDAAIDYSKTLQPETQRVQQQSPGYQVSRSTQTSGQEQPTGRGFHEGPEL